MKMNKSMNKKPEKVESQIDGFRLPFPFHDNTEKLKDYTYPA